MGTYSQKDISNLVNNTIVFNRKENNVLESLLENTEIPNSSEMNYDQLKEYYNTRITELKDTGKLPSKDTFATQTLRATYEQAAVQLMTDSVQKKDDTFIYYINPLESGENFKFIEDKNENYLKKFTRYVQTLINQHVASTRSLPVLPNKDTWVEFVKSLKQKYLTPPETAQTLPKPSADDEKPEADTKITLGEVPINQAVGVGGASSPPQVQTTHQRRKRVSQSSNILRQLSIPSGYDVDKHSYMILFRNYVRMLRRLSNFTLIHRGLLEEVTYIEYYKDTDSSEIKYDINQPFFIEKSLEDRKGINKRIAENMRMFRLHPYRT